MRLPNFKRLFKQDFPAENQTLVEKLAESLNGGIEILYETFNKKVTLKENVACTVREVDVIVDSTGKPTTTTGMSLDVKGKVEGMQVIRAENLTNSTSYVIGQPFISFTTTESNVIFNNITGLAPGQKYRIKVVAFQG